MKSWKKISEKLLLEHPRISIYEDEVELPNGKRTQYLRFTNRGDAAQVIVVDGSGKILVQKEYSYPPNEWLYQFPGGKIDNNESPADGAKRELAEESQYSADLTEIGWFYVDNRRSDSKFHVFMATNIKTISTHSSDDEEEFEHYWLTEEEIDHLIKDGDIKNYSFLAAWAFYKTRNVS